ncbi:sulfur oxidation c-type cytochrome SoxX [Roseibacterium sp. SDUM158016]|uniref:sulfur oxidation c-type cytochrome SoxX n=1 Tax=Roseicyclus sediminis TaxID=2980997 RepID=UPI0021CF2891|nr:sulfur oxidation c-type cytochrome SoxX [Roseibacterium sp. SDUM158016]MCU4651413.1 sulfur oxidation c-type cytochrome SoxX [Roseibacterium sp. SDUM158016]
MLAAGFALAATTLHADVILPDDVVTNEYGDIAQSLTGVPGDAAAGRDVMVNRGLGNCIACHQVTALEDEQFHGEVGPSLDGVGARWDEAALRGIVANAKMAFPDSIMPSFYRVSGFTRPGNAFTGRAAEGPLEPLLTAQQVEDVVAYLMTLTE